MSGTAAVSAVFGFCLRRFTTRAPEVQNFVAGGSVRTSVATRRADWRLKEIEGSYRFMHVMPYTFAVFRHAGHWPACSAVGIDLSSLWVQVWAYHPSRTAGTPPGSEWNVPHDGDVDPSFTVSAMRAPPRHQEVDVCARNKRSGTSPQDDKGHQPNLSCRGTAPSQPPAGSFESSRLGASRCRL